MLLLDLVFIAVLILVAALFPNPTPFQYTVFRHVIAICVAAAAALLPGSLGLQWGIVARATGALAVLVLVYSVTLARLEPPPPPDSVTVSLLDGLTLRAAIVVIAEGGNASANFLPSCTPSILNTQVRGGQMAAKNRVELISQLQYRLIGPTQFSFHVTYFPEKGVYEIDCSG